MTKRSILWLIVPVLAWGLATPASAADLGLGIRGGTYGIGADFGVGITNWFAVRVGGSFGDLSGEYEETGVTYDGDLTLGDMSGDVRADVGVGEVRVRTQEEYVASVDLEVGVGGASMRPDPRRRSRERSWGIKLGDDLRWNDGDGEAHIRIDVGVGDIDVRLR